MGTTGRFRVRLLLVAALCLIGGLAASRVVTRPPSPTIIGPAFAPGAVVSGATLGQWSARHWQWTVSIPIGRNPGHDVTGASCGTGQDGPVFFLPSNFPPCVVPADRIISVPVVAAECSTAEPPPFSGETAAELRACAKDEADRFAVLVVRVDGVLVPDIDTYRASSPPFRLTLPENNVLGGAPGPALAVADGYHLLLAPLSPGPHEIMVHVELADGTVFPDKVARLTVVEPEV